jgi:stage II sporulation protein P
VKTAEETAETDSADSAGDSDAATRILLEKLKDFDYLVQNYYIVDSSTTIRSTDLNAEELLSENLAVDQMADGPQILIYHTHSQEGYQDSEEGDPSTSVVALGEKLTELLTERGFRVLHHKGEYDVDDRDHAYSNAAPAIQKLLEDNPTIEVVIDLHRDSVPETNRLVTTIDGKPTAKIMFFNGLCRTTASGDLTSLQNPYLKDNLAFSLQMQIAAAQAYPDLTRKIYLKGYRYNMHFCPKSLLVEVGAQNNTFEEALNAMEPLAELLAEVLQ